MKHWFLLLSVGAMIGAFCMHAHDNAAFARQVRQQADGVLVQGATSAHNALRQ